jgi:GAF domain-containing protein
MQMEQTNATHVNGAGSQAQARSQAAARPQSPTRAQAPADTFSPDYALLAAQVRSLAEEDAHWLPVLANASALVMESLPDLNWAGFYLMRGGRLVLGPFQGKVACVHIEVGRGVCGTAAELDETQLVANVHEFAGHIACDSTSNSEVVVPIHADGKVVGVLDIDSPLLDRFDEVDASGLEAVVAAIEEVADFSGLA